MSIPSTAHRHRTLGGSRFPCLLLLASLSTLPAAAQPTPDGSPFVLGGVGLAAFERPRVASSPGGEVVALWVGECPELAVCARTWDALGSPVAGPLPLPIPVEELEEVPALAAVAGGGFWVAWSRPELGFAREVVMRRFAASGAALGLERVVASEAGQVLAAPALGVDAGGAPVAAFERRRFEGEVGGQPVTVGVEVRARRFAADGAAIGDPFRVDAADGELVAAPAIAVAPGGGFLVAWESFGFDADEDDVLARRFAPGPDGGAIPAGPPVQTHPSGAGRQVAPAAAASAEGTFLVAWEGPEGGGRRVFAQVYGVGGALWPAPFGLGVAVADQRRPAAAGGEGAFVVAWEDGREGGSLFAQRRDAEGDPLEGGFRVDAGGGVPLAPAVAALPGAGAEGGLFAAWSERLPDFSRRVLGRRYAGTVPPPEPCVPAATALCLGPGGRFRVTAAWATAAGDAGSGSTRPLTADTGTFWFFDATNLELVVKVLAACPVNGRHWVFAAGLTDVAVTLTVDDTATGARRTYTNPQSTAFQPIQDTAAFGCP
ncbi:MAG TPA: hypothetical protein VF100_05965 [Thermoanaerobaculia bacterium]